MAVTTTPVASPQTMQGIQIPSAVVAPKDFYARTRRTMVPFVSNKSFAGLGSSDVFSLLQSNICAGIVLRLVGTVVTLKGTGAIATTSRWPYDLMKKIRIAANGQSQIINCSGLKLKARDQMALEPVSDRGVTQSINGANVSQGTLSMNSESWGLGQAQSAIADGTYSYDIFVYIPLAFDRRLLHGALFLQTTATDLTLAIDWASLTDLFTLSGTAAVTVTCQIQAEAVSFSIPEENGTIIIPDLSAFHSLIENRYPQVALGDNEFRLVGQGVGRQLLRVFGQVWNNGSPLSVIDSNIGQILWRYGGNDTPETALTGRLLRQQTERLFDCDLGASEGFWCWDWAAESAFRDAIDEGSVTELRVLINLNNGLTLTNPFIEYVQETIFAGAIGA